MTKKNINKLYPVFYLLLVVCSVFHRLYYRRFKVAGRNNIPAGKPVIFAANHQNALMDALAVIFAARSQVVFLARADIFRKKSTARLLRFIRILPVYRIRDGYSSLGQNQETFGEVNDALKRKIPIGIFPEGLHLGMKKLKPLRKGIARMAFQAEKEAGFQLDLHIVPVGLDYSNYHRAGSDLLVIFGKPLRVADYHGLYIENPNLAILKLRNDLAVSMRELMIDIVPEKEYEIILKASEFYTPFGIKAKKLRDNLLNRFLVRKAVSDQLNQACQERPLIFSELKQEMNSLESNMGSSPSNIISIILQFCFHILLFPAFLYGAILNFFPFAMAIRRARNAKDPHFISSLRFGTGFVFFLIWYIILGLAILLIFKNLLVSAAFILSLPVGALFAFYYYRLLRALMKSTRDNLTGGTAGNDDKARENRRNTVTGIIEELIW